MADVKATKEAIKLVEQFLKENPGHPAAQAFMKGMANAGPLGNIRARQMSEQAAQKQIQKPAPKQVNARTKATRNK